MAKITTQLTKSINKHIPTDDEVTPYVVQQMVQDCEKIVEDISLKFRDWINNNPSLSGTYSSKKLFEIFKKDMKL